MAYYAVLAAQGFLPEDWLPGWASYDSPLGYHPDRNLVPGVEISSRLAGARPAAAVGSALGLRAQGLGSRGRRARRRRRARRGQQPRGDRAGRPPWGSTPDRRGRRQRVGRPTPCPAGSPSGSPSRAGTRSPSTAATTTPSRRPCRDRAARTARRGRRRRGGEVLMTTRGSSSPAPPPTWSRPTCPSRWSTPRSPASSSATSSAATPTGWSTSASASSCWSTSAPGLALTGMRPIVHTFGSFLVERAFEQVKLGFGHQDVGGVLVGSGGSFDIAAGGRTHQSPGDVRAGRHAPRVPDPRAGHAARGRAVLRAAVAGDGLHYVRVVEQTNAVLPGAARPLPRRTARLGGPPCSRSGRC